jgi:hypothetical protein
MVSLAPTNKGQRRVYAFSIDGEHLVIPFSPFSSANWRAPGALSPSSLLQISLQQKGIRKPGAGLLALDMVSNESIRSIKAHTTSLLAVVAEPRR